MNSHPDQAVAPGGEHHVRHCAAVRRVRGDHHPPLPAHRRRRALDAPPRRLRSSTWIPTSATSPSPTAGSTRTVARSCSTPAGRPRLQAKNIQVTFNDDQLADVGVRARARPSEDGDRLAAASSPARCSTSSTRSRRSTPRAARSSPSSYRQAAAAARQPRRPAGGHGHPGHRGVRELRRHRAPSTSSRTTGRRSTPTSAPRTATSPRSGATPTRTGSSRRRCISTVDAEAAITSSTPSWTRRRCPQGHPARRRPVDPPLARSAPSSTRSGPG